MKASSKTASTPQNAEVPENMFAEERKIRILEEIAQRKKVTVADLAEMFGVSGATIRIYLRDLERSGLLIRTHGGAIAKTKTGFEPDSRQKEVEHLEQKRKIAAAALKLIEDGDTIILDTGTTALELAKTLRDRKNLTVVTNDLVIAQLLEGMPTISILFMGGMIRKGFHCAVGTQGREVTVGLTADKAFLGTNGFSAAKGATTPDINQAETKKRMVAMASKVVLLCDRSKIGKVSFAQFAAPEEIDVLITDRLEDAERVLFAQRGIDVITAE